MGRLILGLAVVLLTSSHVNASVVFSESFTGAELNSDARVSFPTRTPSINGSSLLFDTGVEFSEKLFVLSLLDADSLSSYDPVIVDISMNLTVARANSNTYPTDHDPAATIGDGTSMFGFLAADNFEGSIDSVYYLDDGSRGELVEILNLVNPVGYPEIGESFDVFGRLTLFDDFTELYAMYMDSSASHVFDQSIDRTQPFSFAFTAHDADERYQMNSLSIQITGIPEFAILGDFDCSGILDSHDIDMLTAEIRKASPSIFFDVSEDAAVNDFDRFVWVTNLANTYFGDANLDGEFNSSDFVAVFQAGEYEDQIAGNSTWAEGDWNGDGDFTSSDFVLSLQGGGYEKGPRLLTHTVPEPRYSLIVVFLMLSFCESTKRQKR